MKSLHAYGRSVFIGLILALLVACGGAATPTEPAADTAATEAPVATTEAAVEAPATDTNGTRTVETRFGPVEIPANPQRVVTLDEGALDTAVAVGVIPVGAVSSRLSTGVAPYIADRVPSIAIVGNPGEANFEAVIAAQPDLILASNWIDEETYKTLSAIAPTVSPENGIGNWEAAATEYATALGRSAEIETVLAEIETRIQALRDELNLEEGTTGAVIRWMPQGPLVAGRLLPGVRLLEKVGFTLPQVTLDLGDQTPHTDILSLEQLAEVNTDWLIIATFNEEGAQALNTAREDNVFSQLDAVQNNQVIPVSAQLWSSTFGPLATQAMLDDLTNRMTGTTN